MLSVRVVRRFVEVRVTGLAAEMTYYLILSLVPLVTALGATLGFLGDVLGRSSVRSMETALVSAVEAVLSPELAAEVAVPLVKQLLRQEQVGVAIGSVAGALWLGSRVFRAAMRALGDAYQVAERRRLPVLWGLSLVFTLAAVIVVALLLSLIVVGPLLGGGRWLADVLGAGEQFQQAWNLGRWPLVLFVGVVFLAWLYRVGQTADDSWRDALPGALLATVTLVALAAAFRLYVDVAGPQAPDISSGSDAVAVVGRFIGTALATMLFGWLASIVVLMGGVFNAEWNQIHRS
jgi:membrane protein